MLPTKFRFIWPSSFRGQDFKKSANQKQELPVAAMFVNRSGRNEQSSWRTFHRSFLPSFLPPCLLTDRDEMINLHRGLSIDASYQVSVHLVKRFQRRRFLKKSANQKQELPVAAMFDNGS